MRLFWALALLLPAWVSGASAAERLVIEGSGFSLVPPSEFRFSEEAKGLVASNEEAVVHAVALPDSLFLAVREKGPEAFIAAAGGDFTSVPSVEVVSTRGREFIVVRATKEVMGLATDVWWASTGPDPSGFIQFMQRRDVAKPIFTDATVMSTLATVEVRPAAEIERKTQP